MRRTARPTDQQDAISRLSRAIELLERGDTGAAIKEAEKAKRFAPRSASVREVLGLALYGEDRWQEALTELKTYRRISGRVDQNHVMADCLRGMGRPAEAVPLAEEELHGKAPNEAKAEAVIVAASALADQQRYAEALAFLGRARTRDDVSEAYTLRLWYVKGDILAQGRPQGGGGRAVPQGDAPRRERVRRGRTPGSARPEGRLLSRLGLPLGPLGEVPRDADGVHAHPGERLQPIQVQLRFRAGDGLACRLAGEHLDDLVEVGRGSHRTADRVRPLAQPHTAKSHVRSTSAIGPKCANSSVDEAAARIRSMLAIASSRSNSGGGVAGRRTGRSGTWIPSASPVKTTPVDESTSAR